MANQQRLIQFFGDVQGVGFRYTACRAAAGYDIGGYVRNVHDGSVECLVEGDPAEIEAFLNDLAQRMRGYIQRQTQQISPFTGQYASFDVRF